MSLLYVTADKINAASGGGLVTHHESEALKSLGPCEVWGRDMLCEMDVEHDRLEEPWKWDMVAANRLYEVRTGFGLAHFYAGCFTYTVDILKQRGCRIAYTAAAHDVQRSKQEHESLGLPFDYPHLIDAGLWRRYVAGYLAADVLVCPSRHSAGVMRGFGYGGRIEVIPHGCEIPDRVTPAPARFTVGYLGCCAGPDKGLRYLLAAWKKLNYSDATLLLAGRDSTSPFVRSLVREFGGGNIRLLGWVDRIEDFYSQISLYVQPSVTEGFGIEVLESMAHGRVPLCSLGAGAADCLPDERTAFTPGDAEELAGYIDHARDWDLTKFGGHHAEYVRNFSWDKIRARYVSVWRGLL